MNCADFEILLCDYLDGTLNEERRREVEEHMRSCAACGEMAREVKASLAFIEKAALAEPPAELLTRILHDVPGVAAGARRPWHTRIFGRWTGWILQPRYVMGMAMTVLSFSMIAKFAGIEPRQLRPSDLDPVKIWSAADDRVHRVWDRGVKYYENLKVVIEIQSRLREWTDQDQSQAPSGANQKKGAPASTNSAGRNEKQ
jgi:anti-sigma factor RsiW